MARIPNPTLFSFAALIVTTACAGEQTHIDDGSGGTGGTGSSSGSAATGGVGASGGGATTGGAGGEATSGGAGGSGGGVGGAGGGGVGGAGVDWHALQGADCPSDGCPSPLTCLTYCGISCSIMFSTCEIPCNPPNPMCPEGQTCVSIADGPGNVCSP